jgi:hypothetical protein
MWGPVFYLVGTVGSSAADKAARSVNLVTHLHLVSSLRVRRRDTTILSLWLYDMVLN